MSLITQISYHITPIVAILGYINYPKELRINSSLLYGLSLLHNSILIIFSAWTFTSLLQVLYDDGIFFQSNYYFQNPNFDKIMYYFYLSKYYEFLDTFLLYLNGKSPLFLQQYHHVGAVICWHLTYVYKVDAIWIPSIVNSFVHTIMYSYYLGCLLKIKQFRFIKQYLTTLQLCQLLSTMILSNYYYNHIETIRNVRIIWIVDTYNIGLLVLFGSFYVNNYIAIKNDKVIQDKDNKDK
jgi:hypothetical protein